MLVFLEGRQDRTGVSEFDDGGDTVSPGGVQSELVRSLDEGVNISEVDTSEGGQEIDGIYWVNFFPNGMCEKHTIHLRDNKNKVAILRVDPLSGRAEAEIRK